MSVVVEKNECEEREREREIKKTKKCEEYLTGSAGSSEEVLSP